MSKAAMTALPYTAAFKPTSVPGCQMWLDGADPAGTGVAPANGTTVSSWVDKSGNGNSGTAGGTGAAYSSSQKALLFGSLTATPEAGGQRTFTTGNYYTTPYTAAPANETCFVVFSMPVLGFGFMITSHTCNGRSFGTPLFNGTTASLAGGVICASWGVTAYIPLTTSTIYIGELITSSGNQYGTVNGGTLAGPVAQSYNAGTTTDIGGFIALNGYYFNGYIYEIICYNSVLSTNQRQSVEGYLAWKWGIQSSLPQFVPTSVGGTQLWLDGADITTQTFSGANITAWNDKSGNNYHMNQLTATSGQITGSAAYPTAGTAINGKSTVNFSPQAGLKQSNNLNGVRNLYWVGRISNSGGSGYYFLFGQDTYYDWHANPYSPSNRMLWDLYTSAELRNATASLYTLDANAAVNTTFGNINYTSHSSISILSVSGITGSSSLYQGICYDRNTHVGWCGDLAEVLVYSTALTNTQHQQVEGYLAWKWGMQAQLPITHPYYGAAPTVHPYGAVAPTGPNALGITRAPAVTALVPTVKRAMTSLSYNGAFKPTSITGCTLWLDAADATTITGTTSITAWRDKSGNNNNAIFTGTNPSYVAASNVVITANANQNFTVPEAAIATSTGTGSLFMVYGDQQTGGTYGGYNAVWGTANPGSRFYQLLQGGSDTPYAVNGPFTNGTVAAALNTTNTLLYNMNYTYGSSTGDLRINGTTITSSYGGTPSPSGALTISGTGWGVVANLRIYEVIISKGTSVLTTTQIQQVEGYLAWKWGIQASLPGSHPYLAAAPLTPNALGITRAPAVAALVPIPKQAMTSLSYNATFLPTSIAGCAMWLDAADSSSFTFSSGTTISLWKDKSGSANNFTVTTGTTTRITDGGVNVVNFPSGGSTMTSSSSITLTTNHSVFIVTKLISNTFGLGYLLSCASLKPSDNPQGLSGDYSIRYNASFITPSGGNGGDIFFNNTGGYYANGTLSGIPTATSYHMLNGRFSQGGTTQIALSFGGVYGRYFVGTVAEVIIFSQLLTTIQRQQIEGYLAWKWGLQTNLPQFVPTSVGGTQLWLDGADITTQTFSGSNITAWNDKSGNNYHMNQRPGVPSGYSTEYPRAGTAINGKSTIYFGPYVGLKQSNNLNGVRNLYWVGRISNSGGSGYYFLFGQDTYYEWHANQYSPSNRMLWDLYTTAELRNSTASLYTLDANAAVNTTFGNIYYPSNSSISILSVSGITGSSTLYQGICYDRNGTHVGWCGDLAEVLVYSTALTNTQHQQVEGYLAWKWGMQAQLPNTHPYYSAAPTGHPYAAATPVGASLRAPAVAALVPTPSKATTATTKPGYLPFYQVTSNDWTTSWLPYLQKLSATNTGATASSTLGTITGTSVGFYVSSFLAPNGLIYLADNQNNPMGLITPTANGGTYSSTTVTGVGPYTQYGDNYKGGGLASNGIIYLVPFGAPGIGTINTNTNVFTTNPFNVNPGSAAVAGGVSGPDGNIYCAPYVNLSQLFYFTPGANTINSFSISATIRYSKPFLAPNGKIYCLGSTKIVGVIDPIGRTFTEVGTAANQQYGFMVLGGNGVVYAFPQNASGIGTLNLTTNVITANVIAGGTGYYGGILGPDGNIYLYQSGAGNIGVLNTKTNTLSVLTSTSIGYICAVLAPNGNIYLGASSVIVFSGVSLIPTLNFCLTPYLNNGANRF